MPLAAPCEEPPKSTLCLSLDSTPRKHRRNCPLPSCDACPSVEQLEAEIVLAENHLLDLKNRLISVKREVNNRHDPFSLLPMELVSEIFKLYCANAHLWEAPVLIGSVCRRWREVTLMTSKLWANVRISVHDNKPYDLDVAAEWLSRSRSFPLRLEIDFYSHGVPKNDSFSPVIDLLRSHSARWRELCIDPLWISSIIPSLFSNLEKMPSNLESLYLCSPTDDRERNLDTSTLLCPQRLHLYNGLQTIGLPLGWDRLTSLLSIDPLPLDELLHIISNAPMLTECEATCDTVLMDLDGPLFLDVLDDAPITSLSITSLNTESPDCDSENSLDFVTLPSLATLRYHYNCHSAEDADLDSLEDFLDRSSPTLKHFHLTIRPKETDYFDIWRHKDISLTSLKFDASMVKKGSGIEAKTKITNDFMTLLYITIDEGGLVRLRSLEFIPSITPEFWSLLCHLIQRLIQMQSSNIIRDALDDSRPLACSIEPLRSVVIDLSMMETLPVRMDANVHSHLTEMASLGLDITVRKEEYGMVYPFHELDVNLDTPPTDL